MVKYFKCPKCNNGFKAPAVDQKFTGLGYTIPGLGVIVCPECHYRDRRKRFIQITEGEVTQEKPVPSPEVKPEVETLEDSKFESE